jgi:hypothetical protein
VLEAWCKGSCGAICKEKEEEEEESVKSTQKTVSRKNPSKKTASKLHPPIGKSITAKNSSNQTALVTPVY